MTKTITMGGRTYRISSDGVRVWDDVAGHYSVHGFSATQERMVLARSRKL